MTPLLDFFALYRFIIETKRPIKKYYDKEDAMITEEFIPSDKWEMDVRRNGYSIVPNQVFFINQFLHSSQQLSATELLLMLNLLTWWWHKDSYPFPSKTLLAQRLGLSPRQVQRAIKSLEDKRILKTIPRYNAGKQTSNFYDLSLFVNLIKQCVAYVEADTPAHVMKKAA